VTLRLRPGKRGLELRLHELEAAIMDVVWSRKLVRFAVADVLSVLEQRRSIAYTTVMTTVSRLFDKALLSRERDGKRYLYSPRMTRQEFLEATARDVLRGAVDEPTALALLSEKVSEASADELDELEVLIRERRQELRR
jgi:predicted transcriptional regulator